jgi:hypothetical protein
MHSILTSVYQRGGSCIRACRIVNADSSPVSTDWVQDNTNIRNNTLEFKDDWIYFLKCTYPSSLNKSARAQHSSLERSRLCAGYMIVFSSHQVNVATLRNFHLEVMTNNSTDFSMEMITCAWPFQDKAGPAWKLQKRNIARAESRYMKGWTNQMMFYTERPTSLRNVWGEASTWKLSIHPVLIRLDTWGSKLGVIRLKSIS